MEFTDDGALFKGINALRERGREWFQCFYLVERSNKQTNFAVERSTKRSNLLN
jgi:hypothetical protein